MAVSKPVKSKKRLLINALHAEECRVAIVDGDVLEDIHIEKASMEQTRGNIYKAVVMRVEPGLQAAFVEFEKDRKHGFLQFKEIRPEDYHPRDGATVPDHPRIQDVLFKKQELLVQVEKDARDQKGASLTTYISLAGRYLVMAVGQSKVGISRKIEDTEDRGRLRDIARELTPPEGFGLIVRTSGLSQSEDTLKAELDHLVAQWKEIESRAASIRAPALIHQEQDVVIRAVRDYLTDDVGEILVDNREVSQRVKEYLHQHIPALEKRVKLHREKLPLFSKYGVEDQLDLMHERRVQLPSGGTIVIDTTEALTAVDVNSGKTQGEKDLEDLALRTNLEAVEVIARHLRLRDLGGLIVIDFIDMIPGRNRRAVEEALEEALKKDKAKTDVSRISKFGLLEVSRQRLRPSFQDSNYITCPVCGGLGHYRSPEFVAMTVLREIEELVEQEDVVSVRAELPLEAANYLLNQKRTDLVEFEKRSGKRIEAAAATVDQGHYRLRIERESGQVEERDSSAAGHEEESRKRKKKRSKKKKGHSGESVNHVAAPAQTADQENEAEPSDIDETKEETAGDDAQLTGSENQASAPGRKRRRRRRRRRSSRGDQGAGPLTEGQTASDEPVAESHEPLAAHATTEPAIGAETQAPTADAASAKAKKKRRRRGRRPEKVEGGAAPTPEAAVEDNAQAPATDNGDSVVSSPAVRKKRHRKKPGTRRRADQAESEPQETGGAEPGGGEEE